MLCTSMAWPLHDEVHSLKNLLVTRGLPVHDSRILQKELLLTRPDCIQLGQARLAMDTSAV